VTTRRLGPPTTAIAARIGAAFKDLLAAAGSAARRRGDATTSHRLKLFQDPSPYRRVRTPVRLKRHSLFSPGWIVTVLGRRWSRSWGILPAGTRLDPFGHPDTLGGGCWKTKYTPKVLKAQPKRTTTRPVVAVCRWRYR
jgi:hypothetical protein